LKALQHVSFFKPINLARFAFALHTIGFRGSVVFFDRMLRRRGESVPRFRKAAFAVGVALRVLKHWESVCLPRASRAFNARSWASASGSRATAAALVASDLKGDVVECGRQGDAGENRSRSALAL
jgi:hypothetical protein